MVSECWVQDQVSFFDRKKLTLTWLSTKTEEYSPETLHIEQEGQLDDYVHTAVWTALHLTWLGSKKPPRLFRLQHFL